LVNHNTLHEDSASFAAALEVTSICCFRAIGEGNDEKEELIDAADFFDGL
jgi:hypothetical protein